MQEGGASPCPALGGHPQQHVLAGPKGDGVAEGKRAKEPAGDRQREVQGGKALHLREDDENTAGTRKQWGGRSKPSVGEGSRDLQQQTVGPSGSGKGTDPGAGHQRGILPVTRQLCVPGCISDFSGIRFSHLEKGSNSTCIQGLSGG